MNAINRPDPVDELTKPSEVAKLLDDAIRVGGIKDEPEGTRYIQLSDTLARIISKALRAMDK